MSSHSVAYNINRDYINGLFTSQQNLMISFNFDFGTHIPKSIVDITVFYIII